MRAHYLRCIIPTSLVEDEARFADFMEEQGFLGWKKVTDSPKGWTMVDFRWNWDSPQGGEDVQAS